MSWNQNPRGFTYTYVNNNVLTLMYSFTSVALGM